MPNYKINYSKDHLEHYGVLGMKWGVWNEETKARYSSNKAERKLKKHEKLLKSTNAKELYRNRKDLSDKELQDRINRLNRERELKRIATDDFPHKVVKAVEGMAIGAIAAATIKYGKDLINSGAFSYTSFMNIPISDLTTYGR